MSDHNIDGLDLERVLTASMTDYVDRFEVPAFRPVRLRKPVWPRRVAMGFAVAAIVGVASGVAVLNGSDASPAAPTAPGTTGSLSTSPRHTVDPSAVAGPGGVVGALVFAAELYENPATRSRVDLNAVRALFIDDSAFQHYWGTDARGVTCGRVVDGAVETGTRVEYLYGAESTWDAVMTLDGASSAISRITCVAPGNVTKPPASYAVMGYYGSLLDAFRMTDVAAENNAIGMNEVNELSVSLHAAKDIFAASTCSTKHFGVWFGYGSTGDPQKAETLHIVTDVASPFTVTTGLVGQGSGGIVSVECNTP